MSWIWGYHDSKIWLLKDLSVTKDNWVWSVLKQNLAPARSRLGDEDQEGQGDGAGSRQKPRGHHGDAGSSRSWSKSRHCQDRGGASGESLTLPSERHLRARSTPDLKASDQGQRVRTRRNNWKEEPATCSSKSCRGSRLTVQRAQHRLLSQRLHTTFFGPESCMEEIPCRFRYSSIFS